MDKLRNKEAYNIVIWRSWLLKGKWIDFVRLTISDNKKRLFIFIAIKQISCVVKHISYIGKVPGIIYH